MPTFFLGFVWHLVLFKESYDGLAMYRHNVIIPFGLLSMTIQAVLFAWIYEQSFARAPRRCGRAGFRVRRVRRSVVVELHDARRRRQERDGLRTGLPR